MTTIKPELEKYTVIEAYYDSDLEEKLNRWRKENPDREILRESQSSVYKERNNSILLHFTIAHVARGPEA